MIPFIMLPEHAPPRPLRILHLEDSPVDHDLVRLALRKSGEQCELERVETLAEFGQRVQSSNFDIILADYRLPGWSGHLE